MTKRSAKRGIHFHFTKRRKGHRKIMARLHTVTMLEITRQHGFVLERTLRFRLFRLNMRCKFRVARAKSREQQASGPMRLGQLAVTPFFWADRSLLSTALLPLSMLVSAGARLRESVAAAPFVAPCDPSETPTIHRARRLAHTR